MRVLALFIVIVIVATTFQQLSYCRPVNSDNLLKFEIDTPILKTKYNPTLIFEEGIIVEHKDAKLDAAIIGKKMEISLVFPEIEGLIHETEITSFEIDALGNHKYPVPGVYYLLVGVRLVIDTYIEATVESNELNMYEPQVVEWHKSGNKTIVIEPDYNKSNGDIQEFSIKDIRYNMEFTLETALGVSFASLGLFDIASYSYSFSSMPTCVQGSLNVVTWWSHNWAIGLGAIVIVASISIWIVLNIFVVRRKE